MDRQKALKYLSNGLTGISMIILGYVIVQMLRLKNQVPANTCIFAMYRRPVYLAGVLVILSMIIDVLNKE
ncbi:MAG: hypothetical protein Q4P28_05830 [Tissierellia bacterium]|nr:hypothetical protein [Tissierellia bacterium]